MKKNATFNYVFFELLKQVLSNNASHPSISAYSGSLGVVTHAVASLQRAWCCVVVRCTWHATSLWRIARCATLGRSVGRHGAEMVAGVDRPIAVNPAFSVGASRILRDDSAHLRSCAQDVSCPGCGAVICTASCYWSLSGRRAWR